MSGVCSFYAVRILARLPAGIQRARDMQPETCTAACAGARPAELETCCDAQGCGRPAEAPQRRAPWRRQCRSRRWARGGRRPPAACRARAGAPRPSCWAGRSASRGGGARRRRAASSAGCWCRCWGPSRRQAGPYLRPLCSAGSLRACPASCMAAWSPMLAAVRLAIAEAFST